jgi:hypothetical protein
VRAARVHSLRAQRTPSFVEACNLNRARISVAATPIEQVARIEQTRNPGSSREVAPDFVSLNPGYACCAPSWLLAAKPAEQTSLQSVVCHGYLFALDDLGESWILPTLYYCFLYGRN